jgi:hypothetical protein
MTETPRKAARFRHPDVPLAEAIALADEWEAALNAVDWYPEKITIRPRKGQMANKDSENC